MSYIPNTTPTPNWLYNGEMKKMSDTELRVVLCITRKTLGWIENQETGMRKQEDWISHNQLIEMSGKSSRSISYAVDNCVKHGWIEVRDKNGNLLLTSQERQRNKLFYRLGNIFTDKLKSTANNAVETNLPHFTTKSTALYDTNLPQRLRNTKETLTKETIQKIAEQTPHPPLKKELTPLQREFNLLWDYFKEQYAQKISEEPPIMSYPKLFKIGQPILRQFGLEPLKRKIDLYFDRDDPFFKRVGWSMDIFLMSTTLNGLK